MERLSTHTPRRQRRGHEPADWWADGDYALRERAYAPIHTRLIDRLDPGRGECVLDLACGLGALAARAAHRGAEVTAIDLAPGMIERARRRPEQVDWRIADCQALPFPDNSFDVVMSSFGVIFAPDPARAAAEIARVCRGRLAFTAWVGDPGRDLWTGCAPTYAAARTWSSETEVARLLPSFDIASEEGVWWLQGRSGEAIWSWVVRTSPPVRARLRELSAVERREARVAWIRRYETYRLGDRIHVPQMYLLTVGHKQWPTGAPSRLRCE